MDDGQIIQGLIEGREQAAEALCERYHERIMWTLLHLGVPERDRVDVAQEVLVDVWRQLSQGRFRQESGLFTWLYQIIRGKVADYRKREQRRPHLQVAVDPEAPQLEAPLRPDQEARMIAGQALEHLPFRHRFVFVRHHHYGEEPEAIARKLGIAKKTVQNLLSEARQKFEESIREGGKLPPTKRLTGEKGR